MPDDHDLFFHNLSLLWSSIVSQPLYFSYFIFFSPYLLKLIFLVSSSPLFFTTILVLVLSVIATGLPHSKQGFLQTIVDKLNRVDGEEDEVIHFEDFEIYKIVFRDPPLIMEDTVAKERRLEILFEELDRFEESTAAIEMKKDFEQVIMTSSVSGNDSIVQNPFIVSSDLTAAIDMKKNLEHVNMTSAISGDELRVRNSFTMKSESRRVDSTAAIVMKSDLENDVEELQKPETVKVTSSFSSDDLLTGHSSFTEKSNSSRFNSSSSFGSFESIEEDSTAPRSDLEEFEKLHPVTSSISGEVQSNSRRLNDSTVKVVTEFKKLNPVTSSIPVNSIIKNKNINNLLQFDCSTSFGSYGSMRKEKDWKRTLACKLFEERRSLEGGEEGMDSLWESYETDNSRKSKTNNKTKSEFKYFVNDENDEDDDEFSSNGQFCCLKALKLSTGKMNLGMGKPNLVKISKALKGFGWLHHVGSRHGKKK